MKANKVVGLYLFSKHVTPAKAGVHLLKCKVGLCPTRFTIFLSMALCLFCSHLFAVNGDMGGGNGSEASPWLIEDLLDFHEFAGNSNYWDDHTRLQCDLNLTGTTYTTAVIAPDSSTSYGFQGMAFTGVFEGGGYSLLNLKINSSIADYVGLFGNIDSGKVKNLCLIDINIQADDYIGGLAGKNSGVIINCGVTGNVSGDDDVGGVFGLNIGTLVSCFYQGGTVSGDHTSGGLLARNSGAIKRSYAIGTVNGRAYVGGLTGATHGLVEQCFADCMVLGDSYVGGLSGDAGEVSIVLLNCYALGRVEGTDMTGGLVGNLHGATPIAVHCYSAAQVIPPAGCDGDPWCRVGGLVGSSEFSYAEPNNCFWDTEASGLSDGVGNQDPDPAGVMGKATAEMQTLSIFTVAGWDFVTPIWTILEGVDYPRLWWENSKPVADAGEDQTVYARHDGTVQITLDGSGSYDEDGDELSYSWRLGGQEIATGVNPTVEMVVSEPNIVIELIVSDGIEESEPDEVLITVVPALEVWMKITPRLLNCRSKGNWLKSHLTLPEGLTVEDVNPNRPMTIEPLGIDSDHLNIFINDDDLVEIEAAFEREAFCGASNDWPDELIVFGWFTNGKSFYGTAGVVLQSELDIP